jgi:hypothetical protein
MRRLELSGMQLEPEVCARHEGSRTLISRALSLSRHLSDGTTSTSKLGWTYKQMFIFRARHSTERYSNVQLQLLSASIAICGYTRREGCSPTDHDRMSKPTSLASLAFYRPDQATTRNAKFGKSTMLCQGACQACGGAGDVPPHSTLPVASRTVP